MSLIKESKSLNSFRCLFLVSDEVFEVCVLLHKSYCAGGEECPGHFTTQSHLCLAALIFTPRKPEGKQIPLPVLPILIRKKKQDNNEFQLKIRFDEKFQFPLIHYFILLLIFIVKSGIIMNKFYLFFFYYYDLRCSDWFEIE